MERALSDVLRTEEARPVEGYADAEPAPAFALGYVQVGPNGETTVRGRGGAALLERAAKLGAADAGRRANAPAQLPGTTVGLAGEDRAAPAAPAAEMKDERRASAYDALRSLNKAVAQRVERQQKAKSADGDVMARSRLAESERDDTSANEAAAAMADA